MAEVRLTLEEYDNLVRNASAPEYEVLRKNRQSGKIRVKRKGKKDPKMARALKKANAWGRTKSGKMRKGVTQAKIMKKAHQLRRKMR